MTDMATGAPKAAETPAGLASVEAVMSMLAESGYIATPEIATAVYLAFCYVGPKLMRERKYVTRSPQRWLIQSLLSHQADDFLSPRLEPGPLTSRRPSRSGTWRWP